MQYIMIFSSAGSGALLFLNLYYFKTGKKRNQFIIFFTIDLFFSVITGFKGAIVMSFLVVALAYYLMHQKVKYYYFLIVAFSIIFAYAIINPYRYYIQKNASFQKNSITSIVQGFIDSYKASRDEKSESDNLAIIKRFNFLPELTKFQEYKTEHGLKKDDPDFVFITLTTPIQIFVPRAMWKDRPKADLGLTWVTQKVFGRSYNSSTAFGPIGFLYLTGGAFAILFGFALVGFFLQIINQFFVSGNWGGIIIALALLMNTISLEAQFNFYIVAFFQTIILALIFQFIMLKNQEH